VHKLVMKYLIGQQDHYRCID